ncbi:hypothetical protein [Phyllobacterium sp. P5_D12]
MEIDLGEVLDPFRRHVIHIKDALSHARYRYDGLDLILESGLGLQGPRCLTGNIRRRG